MSAGAIPYEHAIFDPERQKLFCEHFAKTGLWYESAQAAGVPYRTVKRYLVSDDGFREMLMASKHQHSELIEKAIMRRGVIGWFDETIVKDKDTGVETKKTRRYHASDKLLLAYARRHIKAYRNLPLGPTVTVNTNTQVNVAAFDTMDEGQRGALRAFLESVKAKQVEAAATAEAANGHANGHANGNGNGTTQVHES